MRSGRCECNTRSNASMKMMIARLASCAQLSRAQGVMVMNGVALRNVTLGEVRCGTYAKPTASQRANSGLAPFGTIHVNTNVKSRALAEHEHPGT